MACRTAGESAPVSAVRPVCTHTGQLSTTCCACCVFLVVVVLGGGGICVRKRLWRFDHKLHSAAALYISHVLRGALHTRVCGAQGNIIPI